MIPIPTSDDEARARWTREQLAAGYDYTAAHYHLISPVRVVKWHQRPEEVRARWKQYNAAREAFVKAVPSERERVAIFRYIVSRFFYSTARTRPVTDTQGG